MTTLASAGELLRLDAQHVGTSSWVTIDQSRINGFAEFTGDQQWIHVDPARAAAGPFGRTVAHGYLTLSLVPVVLDEVLVIEGLSAALNYGLEKVRFPTPVLVDSRVRGHVRLLGASQRAEMVQANLEVTIEIEDRERPACVAEVVVLYA